VQGSNGVTARPWVKRDPPEEPPSEERYGVERQVSWLTGQHGGSGLPGRLAPPSDTKWNRRSPLTVAGAAPDSAQKGTTGFPS
jgi:hypothetical protein